MGKKEVRHSPRRWGILVAGVAMALLLSACAAPAQPASPPTAAPTIQSPTGPPPADLQLAHLQQAAYNYARYHALVLRQVYPERSRRTQDRLPDNLLGPSARLRTSLKRLAEVCAALEYPSTEPFGEAQDRLSARAGVEDESCRPTAEQAMGEWSREAEVWSNGEIVVALISMRRQETW